MVVSQDDDLFEERKMVENIMELAVENCRVNNEDHFDPCLYPIVCLNCKLMRSFLGLIVSRSGNMETFFTYWGFDNKSFLVLFLLKKYFLFCYLHFLFVLFFLLIKLKRITLLITYFFIIFHSLKFQTTSKYI